MSKFTTSQNDCFVKEKVMTDELAKAIDPVEALIAALAAKLVPAIKEQLMPEIQQMIAEDSYIKMEAERIDGLDEYISAAIDEHDRNNKRSVHADDIDELEKTIEDVIKQANISLDISF